MLNKLLRYELKCTRRTFLPMLAAMVLFTLLTKSMELLCNVFSFIKIPYTIMFAVNLVLLVLSVFAAILFLIQRFYKNMTGSEGYLMFSLPVRVATHLFSKWLISIFWIFVTAACGVGLGVLLIPSDQYTVLRAFMDTADLTLRQTMGLSLDRMVSLLVPMRVSSFKGLAQRTDNQGGRLLTAHGPLPDYQPGRVFIFALSAYHSGRGMARPGDKASLFPSAAAVV